MMLLKGHRIRIQVRPPNVKVGDVLFRPPAPPMMEMVHRTCMSVCIINKDTESSCVTIARYEM